MCRLRKKGGPKSLTYPYGSYTIKVYPFYKTVEIFDGNKRITRFRIETLSRHNSAYKALIAAMIERYIAIYESDYDVTTIPTENL